MAPRLPLLRVLSKFLAKKNPMCKIIWASLLLIGCAVQQKQEPVPPEQSRLVYHIQPDPSTDDPHFTLCDIDKAYPYYGTDTHTRRDKRQLLTHFQNGFTPSPEVHDTGFISIRFMVNCMGVAGRFRVTEFDTSYGPMKFDTSISSQLLKLTKDVKDWEPIRFASGSYDSYCYFLFKIEGGKLTDVLP